MSLIDFWDFQPLELKESNKPHVLGVAQGNFFFTDRPSRNKRKYSNEAWESALADENVKRTMKNGNLLGTVGHADVDYDTLIREGKVSHRTTKLVLNKNGTGYGEAEIVDTPVGRVLYNLMKSGSKIAVSSKAVGESKGKDDDGNDLVDPKTFKLSRFDFVVDPGFLDATPSLKEQLNEAYSATSTLYNLNEIKEEKSVLTEKSPKEDNMELLEKVMEEKVNLEKSLDEATKTLLENGKKIAVLEEAVKTNDKLKAEVEMLTEKIKETQAFFEKVGNAEEVLKTLEASKAFIEKVNAIGTVDEITEALEVAKEHGELLENIGAIEEIQEALVFAKKMGEAVKALGGIDVIQEALDGTHAYISAISETAKEDAIAEIASTFGVEDKDVAEAVEQANGNVEMVRGLYEKFKDGKVSKTIDETKPETSRASRMMESIGKMAKE